MENMRITFPARPDRRLETGDFRVERTHLAELAPGQVTVASHLLGIDPGVVLRLTGRAPFSPPYHLGDVVPGSGIGTIIDSRDPARHPGEVVFGPLGWQQFAQVNAKWLESWEHCDLPLSASLSSLGSPGLTAYFGMELGGVGPDDCVVISSAAGSVGSHAAQIAKLRGARVIGIAGGQEKCAWLRDTVGVDAAIDYKAEADLSAAVLRECPAGLTMYLDTVGGDILNAALGAARDGARFILCGAISEFDGQPDAQQGLRT
jgi:NADPH-dependent curcumin reductase CurA